MTSLTTLGTNGETAGEGNEAMSGPGDGDGDPGDGDPGDGDGDPGDGDPDDGGSTKWDLAPLPDSANNCATGGGGNGDPEFSYLWAANSSQGTISKIDTVTVTEVGRYQVRPDGAGSPSRTSVSLSGHVAVASRSGGVTKFYATEENCEESNGMPGIQTSLNNVALPWAQEECRAWHLPFGYSSQRPVAWAPGDWNSGSCSWEHEKLWSDCGRPRVEPELYGLSEVEIARPWIAYRELEGAAHPGAHPESPLRVTDESARQLELDDAVGAQ
jgi:hypothetical protein